MADHRVWRGACILEGSRYTVGVLHTYMRVAAQRQGKMNKYGFNHPQFDRRAHDSGMKLLFGLAPTAKWPAEGIPTRIIMDRNNVPVRVWVAPLGAKNGKRRASHRVQCQCPGCGVVLSAGRLGQHVCKPVGQFPSGVVEPIVIDDDGTVCV